VLEQLEATKNQKPNWQFNLQLKSEYEKSKAMSHKPTKVQKNLAQ
jgi:hypothetical protein